MRAWLSRRQVVAIAAVAIAHGVIPAGGRAGEVGTQDYCYWRKLQGPLCSGGRSKEYWCEYCNDPGTGVNPTRCEWRIVGQC